MRNKIYFHSDLFSNLKVNKTKIKRNAMLNKHQRIPKGQSKMGNPEKQANQGTQDKQNSRTYILWYFDSNRNVSIHN